MLHRCLFAIGLFAAAFAGPSSATAESEQSRSYRAAADITIAADGGVSALDWHSSDTLSESELAELESVVRSWKFQPGTFGGQPVETETTLHLSLDGRERDDGRIGLVVDNAFTGPSLGSRKPPRYPAAGKRRGVSAKVRLKLSINAQGQAKAEVVDYVASDDSPVFRRLFGEAAKAAALQWGVAPERVAGQPVASRWRIPITFCMDDAWCQSHPLPTVAATDGTTVRPGEAMPLDSAAEVLSEVGDTET